MPVVRAALERDNVVALSREATSARLIEPLGHGKLLLDCAVHAPELRRPLSRPAGGGATLLALRTDAESAIGADRLPAGNHDLSAGPPSLGPWLAAIRDTGSLVTDRAHVMIAGVLLGRRVDYTDGRYWKNRAMAEATFGPLFYGRVRFRAAAELLDLAAAAC